MEKSLPADINAERAVLGSVMLERDAIIAIAPWLPSEYFYLEKHAWIYEAMLSCYNRRIPPDLSTIADELRRRDRLGPIGGIAYLGELAAEVPTAVHVEYYARIVERTAILRRLIEVGGKIAGLGYQEDEELEATLDRAEAELFTVSQRRANQEFVHIGKVVDAYFEQINYLNEHRGEVVGVPTGYRDLDELTGGLQPSDLIILAARPSVGKCVAAWTLIDDPVTGERLTIAEAIQRRLGTIYGVGNDGQVRLAAISDWIDSGIQPCYRVRTRTGRMIDVTGHHPFLTARGWQPLHDLAVGDKIAVPRVVPTFGSDESWSLEQVRLLAYVVAEGGLTSTSPAFTRRKKEFPPCVWRWSRRYLAEFLRTLMSCDGSIDHVGGKPRLAFTVAAPALAADVQHAFTRFGFVTTYYQTKQGAWRVEMTDPASVLRYQQEIGLQQTIINGYPPHKDLVLVCDPVQQQNVSFTEWARRSGETTKHGKYAGYNAHLNRSIPHTDVLDDPCQRVLARSDIYWDEIISIAFIGEHQVYDLTVPDGANFIAQDIFVHNTSLALSIAYNVAMKAQGTVGIFSLEMSREQLVQRLLAMHTGIDTQRLRTGNIHDRDLQVVMEAMGVLSALAVYIEDTPGLSIMEVRSRARRLQSEVGIDLLVIDYLQLMQGRRTDNRVQEVSEISRGLKALARELNVPVMALSQLSRAVEGRTSHVPMLSDLRESGSIEQDADIVMFIYREELYDKETDKKGIAEIHLAKHRNGPLGVVPLRFENNTTQFQNLERYRVPEGY